LVQARHYDSNLVNRGDTLWITEHVALLFRENILTP
jgi:hypothetical protein